MSTINSTRREVLIKPSTIIAYVVVIPCAVLMGLPFLWMIITSFALETSIFSYPPTFWPNPIVLSNYAQFFDEAPVTRYLLNSFAVTLLSTIGLLTSCSLAAFSLARLRFPGRVLWFSLIVGTLLIPDQVLLIPRYLIFSRLGLVNTLLPLVIPSFFGSGFGVFLLHQYFRGIPGELVDAAQIDGANPGQTLLRIFLPLSVPAFAALAIFIFLFSWNDLLHPMIYLGNPNTFTFPLGLSRFQNLNQQTNMWTIIMAGATIGVIPPIIVYLIGQRQFVQGIVLSGIKR